MTISRLGFSRFQALLLTGAAVLLLGDRARAVQRFAERPPSQSNLGTLATGTASYMERTVLITGAGHCLFDYFVDSEEGHDFLELRVDGELKFQNSGFDRRGTAVVPLAAGSHVLRFSYTKDAAGDEGSDTGWIDNVRIRQGDGSTETFKFDQRHLGAPAGWTPGGFGGGFTLGIPAKGRTLRRPLSGAFLGYRPTGTKSSIERAFTWPSESSQNVLRFEYFVDSEADHDFLRVLVDGAVRFSASGRNKVGQVSLPIDSGTHVVKLEYDKDESVDEGLDDARVLDLRAMTDVGFYQLDGTSRSAVGAHPEGWSVSPDSTGGHDWVVAYNRQPRLYVVHSSASADPTVNGELLSGEYYQETHATLPDFGGDALPAKLWVEGVPSGALFLGMQVPNEAGSAAQAGTLTLYVDDDHQATREGSTCGPTHSSPGPEDRKFEIAYDPNAGVATVVKQQRGTCGGALPWEDAPPEVAWDAAVSSSVPQNSGGLAHIELSLSNGVAGGLFSDTATATTFGLGARLEAGSLRARLPPEDAGDPLDADVTTWEMVSYSLADGDVGSSAQVRVDGAPRR